ncbi:neuromedin-U [Tachyglossus aculeatus]|uniref:neuromedin-U n=1 Tax=Tachyglossus aculeatus TaxID=9261 RepID=UPI0018F7AFEB|nr:neuromedin-U [Tachyglossus aculeatus]
MQLWNEIEEACSTFLTKGSQSQASNALEELCFMVKGIQQKPQETGEKDNNKRFLFHYTKVHDSGDSDVMASIIHPLLQLIPQLHERRIKRRMRKHEVEEEFPGPGGIQSRGFFLFRPRNGRRSTTRFP